MVPIIPVLWRVLESICIWKKNAVTLLFIMHLFYTKTPSLLLWQNYYKLESGWFWDKSQKTSKKPKHNETIHFTNVITFWLSLGYYFGFCRNRFSVLECVVHDRLPIGYNFLCIIVCLERRMSRTILFGQPTGS